MYNVPEAAITMGKNPLTLKRWIKQGFVPAPVYVDCVRGYPQYLAKEVRAICAELQKHEETYDYLHKQHTDTIERIWRRVENARKN